MEQSWVATALFFAFVIGFMYMMEDMIGLRGIWRVLVAAAFAWVFREYGYLVTEHIADALEMWTGLDFREPRGL